MEVILLFLIVAFLWIAVSCLKRRTGCTYRHDSGEHGEALVRINLNRCRSSDTLQFIIDNLMLVDEKGKSHQIDHVVIRQNGIFCIETKNISGFIFGSENQRRWTQILYRKKYRIINPIKQNKGHIYHLKNTLGKKYKINSLIVMVQNNADKIDIPYVININDLPYYLTSYFDGVSYSSEEVSKIYNTLVNAHRDDISHSEHISSILDTYIDVNNLVCPRCGKKLTERKGKYGKFYGCTGYPKCRFTKDII